MFDYFYTWEELNECEKQLAIDNFIESEKKYYSTDYTEEQAISVLSKRSDFIKQVTNNDWDEEVIDVF